MLREQINLHKALFKQLRKQIFVKRTVKNHILFWRNIIVRYTTTQIYHLKLVWAFITDPKYRQAQKDMKKMQEFNVVIHRATKLLDYYFKARKEQNKDEKEFLLDFCKNKETRYEVIKSLEKEIQKVPNDRKHKEAKINLEIAHAYLLKLYDKDMSKKKAKQFWNDLVTKHQLTKEDYKEFLEEHKKENK